MLGCLLKKSTFAPVFKRAQIKDVHGVQRQHPEVKPVPEVWFTPKKDASPRR